MALVLTLLVLAGCGSSSSPPTSSPPSTENQGGPAAQSKPITVGQTSEETTLDAHMIIGGPGYSVGLNIYDLLMMVDDAGTLQPALATSATTINDTTWELKLRTGVTFHNGDPFDANAVKWSLDRVRNADNKSPQLSYASSISKIEIVDPHTLRIHTKTPDPTLMLNLQMIPIASPAYFEKVGAEEFSKKPVGTGPYKLVEWVKGERIVLEAYDKHWRGTAKAPKITFKTIPDEASLLSALRAGEVDLVTNVPPDAAKGLESNAALKLFTVPSQRSIMIAMDSAAAPFDKKEVRQALNYATNVDEVVQFVLGGFGKQVPTLHAPMYYGYNPNLKPYPYDPNKAKALLAQAGYPNGLSFTMYAPSGRYLKDKDVAQVLVSQWAKVGIKVDLKVHEWGTFLGFYREKKLSPAFLIGYGTPIWDSGSGFRAYASKGAVGSYYYNPEVENLINTGLATVDAEKRKNIYYQINQKIYDEASHVFMYQQVDIYAGRKQLKWTPRSDERVWMFGAELGG